VSTVNVEDLLAERGAIVSLETVRLWINRFRRHFEEAVEDHRGQIPRQAQRFLSANDQINTIFRTRRYKLAAPSPCNQ
jgi:hypothetical protein